MRPPRVVLPPLFSRRAPINPYRAARERARGARSVDPVTVEPALSSAASAVGDLHGIVGIAARLLDALGELGGGLLPLAEPFSPPIPSEVILPLSGFLAQQGAMSFGLVL